MSKHRSAASLEPLAVIGLSCLFPQAANVAEFWSNIRRGVDAITEIPSSHWDVDSYFDADPKSPDMTYARCGGFLSPVDFDPLEFGIAPSNLEAIDTSQLLGLVGAKRALEDAGYGAGREFDRSRVGCILGVTGTLEMVIPLGARLGHPKWKQALQDAGVADDVAADVMQRISESYVPWQENSFPGLLGNVVAGRIANRLDLGGTNCVVDAACASSLSAMHLAALELWSGRSDMMITGGIDTFNDIFMYMCFSKTPALSPTGDARPFSDSADGTILGEGVGMFVLKRLSDAERAGDRVYAVIRGIGTSSDGAGNAVYAPKKEGQIRCLEDAYRMAGVSPETVELIEAHGTGTKVGDATELAGLSEVFQATGKSGRWCAVGSIKSQIGHTKAAAGAAGVMKAILALQHRVLPPTIKLDRPLPALLDETSPLYASLQARPWIGSKQHPRRAGVSAFGFGGSNFHCVLEESANSNLEIDWDRDVFFAAWSAESREELGAKLQAWSDADQQHDLRYKCAEARQAFRPEQRYRLAIVADTGTADISGLIHSAQKGLTQYADRPTWSTPDGIFFGSGDWNGKLGLLFPGQGSQYVGMQRELACRFPSLQNVLNEADEAFAEFAPHTARQRLSDYLYPTPAFDDGAKDRQEAALRDTEVAQPALGAVSLGLLAILADFGVRPDVVAGHSYGELTALCASKRFAPQALYRLSMLRGKLMAEAQDIAGGMLAIGAPLSQVEAALKEAAVDLVIANRNSPTQVVLSGRITELDRATEVFAKKNIRGKRLPVAAAFHSPLVASASQRFRPVLEEIEFAPSEVPVFANTHAGEYPSDPASARALLAGQLAQPVEFVQQIENMSAAGVRMFLEVGPGAVLTGLVGSILSGREHRAVAVDASTGKRSGMLDLGLALGQLATAGLPIRLAAWDPQVLDASVPAKNGSPRLTIPISGANYVKPRTPRPPREKKPDVVSHQNAERGTKNPVEHQIATRVPLPPPAVALPPASISQPSSLTAPPGLLVLQQMFEQTARLHQQFLTSQTTALATLEALVQGTPVVEENRGTRNEERRTPVAIQRAATPATSVPSTPTVVAPSLTSQPSTLNHQLVTLVLTVVAEKTGYPVEMLKPEMSLDHDLGVDSIKRVEILSALQERQPDLPTVTPEQLQTLHRLADVIALLSEGREGRGERQEVQTLQRTAANPQPSTNNPQLSTIVLAVVAEKTGYPVEMLKPEMSLDHDLGVDSIKRVEILSALQERQPDLPTVTPEQLQTLHRLSDVIALLNEGREARGERQEVQPLQRTAANPQPSTFNPQLTVGVPRCVAWDGTGEPLALPAGGTIYITDDGEELSLRIAERLTQLGYRSRLVRLDDPATQSLPEELAGLIVVASSQGMTDQRLWRALEWTQKCGPALRRGGKPRAALFATISRLDGRFGLETRVSIRDAQAGALAGLAKTVRHEWLEVAAKAVDISAAACDIKDVVDKLLHESPLEIGLSEQGWSQISVADSTDGSSSSPPIEPWDLIVVTGGARGVTAACAIAVAKAWRPRLVLCGRTPLADTEPAWLAGRETPHEIKQAIAQNSAEGTPLRQIDQQARRVAAEREIQATLSTIRELGVSVDYVPLEVRNLAAVQETVHDLQQKYGPLRGVIHGAGVLEDRKIEDKTREQFDNVFATKVTGLKNILGSIDSTALRCLAVFSSYTARFGRVGQVDYAMSNEALNKLAGQFQQHHPDCRVRSFNWGPWDGGMVTDSLKPLFAKEGVGLIPMVAGAELLVRELERPETSNVELVVLANVKGEIGGGKTEAPALQPSTLNPQLSTLVLAVIAEKTGYPVEMLKPEMSLDHDLGIDSIKRVEILSALQERRPDLPTVTPEQLGALHRVSDVVALLNEGPEVRGERPEDAPRPRVASVAQPSTLSPQSSVSRVGWERMVDLASHRYLASHVIGGKAVLPTAMMLECLAYAAMHAHPGLEFAGLSNLRVFKGVRLDRDEQVAVRVLTEKAVREGQEFRVPTRLVSEADARPLLHAQAEILLTSTRPQPPVARGMSVVNGHAAQLPADWYSTLLFHGPMLQGLTEIQSLNEHGIVVTTNSAPLPAEWLAEPWRNSWLADPLAIDVALQAIIVWTQTICQRASLPTAIGEYRQYRRTYPRQGLRIVVRAERRNDATVLADAEILDDAGHVVAELLGIEYVLDAQLTAAFRRNRIE